MELPAEAQALFLENHPEREIDHDQIVNNLGMEFNPYPYQRSLATQALKGILSGSEEVSVRTMMCPNSGLMVTEVVVMVVFCSGGQYVDGPHEALGCVVY